MLIEQAAKQRNWRNTLDFLHGDTALSHLTHKASQDAMQHMLRQQVMERIAPDSMWSPLTGVADRQTDVLIMQQFRQPLHETRWY